MGTRERTEDPVTGAELGEIVISNPLLAKVDQLNEAADAARKQWTPVLENLSENVGKLLDGMLERLHLVHGWPSEDNSGRSKRSVKFSFGTSGGKKGHVVSFSIHKGVDGVTEVIYQDVGPLVLGIEIKTSEIAVEPGKYVVRDGLRVETRDARPLVIHQPPFVTYDLSENAARKLGLGVSGRSKSPETAGKLSGYMIECLGASFKRKDFTLLEVNGGKIRGDSGRVPV